MGAFSGFIPQVRQESPELPRTGRVRGVSDASARLQGAAQEGGSARGLGPRGEKQERSRSRSPPLPRPSKLETPEDSFVGLADRPAVRSSVPSFPPSSGVRAQADPRRARGAHEGVRQGRGRRRQLFGVSPRVLPIGFRGEAQGAPEVGSLRSKPRGLLLHVHARGVDLLPGTVFRRTRGSTSKTALFWRGA